MNPTAIDNRNLVKAHSLSSDVYQKSRLYLGLLKAQWNKKPVPLIANLFITGKCNAKCAYCYVDINKNPERKFCFDEWTSIIDTLYKKGTRMISLVGGEPLLHPDIGRLVAYIVEKNIFLNLTTNGFLLGEHLDTVKQATEVSISLDGGIVPHNKNRGKMSFERAAKGIDLAVENGVKVRLCAVVTRYNFDQIDFLIDYAEQRNLFISFTPLIDPPDSRKKAADDMRLSDQKIREFFSRLKEAKKRTSRIINSMANIEYMINYPAQYGHVIFKNSPDAGYYTIPCPYGRLQYLIINTGQIYPCAIMWNNDYFQAKNIFDAGFDEAFSCASNNLPCQCCSFANAVDWNNVTSLPWLWYGIKMTLKQFVKKNGRNR